MAGGGEVLHEGTRVSLSVPTFVMAKGESASVYFTFIVQLKSEREVAVFGKRKVGTGRNISRCPLENKFLRGLS